MFEQFDINTLIEKTGATKRQIEYYIRLGLVPRPHRSEPMTNYANRKATYDVTHVQKIVGVRIMIREGWSPVAQAELQTLPPHWEKARSKVTEQKERTLHPLEKRYIEITSSIRIEGTGPRSPLRDLITNAMSTAGRKELERQKKKAKSLIRARGKVLQVGLKLR